MYLPMPVGNMKYVTNDITIVTRDKKQGKASCQKRVFPCRRITLALIEVFGRGTMIHFFKTFTKIGRIIKTNAIADI